MRNNNGENIGLVRRLLDGDCENFTDRFESFLDQCPSFLHSVGKNRFFPAFFFGMFATVFDTDVADNERIYFRFDNNPDNLKQGNLKIAILTNELDERGSRIVRCYTIADRQDSLGSRFSEQERKLIENKLKEKLKGDDIKSLVYREYKISVWTENQNEEVIKCMEFDKENAFNQDSASPCNGFEEIIRTEEQGYLQDLFGKLASNNANNVVRTTRRVLTYILDIYGKYSHQLNFNGKESDYHGFLSGFLMNFRYRHTAGIYLELFAGRGYADIVFLVRSLQRLKDSVPIIIELKAGKKNSADIALKQAENYVKRCPVSSVTIYTSSEHAVCVGLNFDLDDNQRLQLSTQKFLKRGISVVKGLLELDKNSIKDYLLYPAFGIPAIPNSNIFSYATRFAFASTAFARARVVLENRNKVYVTKYLFKYHDNEKMLSLRRTATTQEKVGDYSVSIVLHTVLEGKETIIVLDLQRVSAYEFLKKAIDLSHWPNARVYEVVCKLDPLRKDDLGLIIDDIKQFNSPALYLKSKKNVMFQGSLLQVDDVSNIHSAADVMMATDWQDVRSHRELFKAISNVLLPQDTNRSLKWIVNNEAEFQAVLHGLFYVCDNPDRVMVEFQLGGGEKLDLVLLQSIESEETHPVGEELKFAGANVEQKRKEADKQLERYKDCKGYKRITEGNEVVLSRAVFNNGSMSPSTLIHVSDILQIINSLEHSSMLDLPP